MDEDDADAALRAALDRLAFATRSAAALSSTLDAVEGLRRVCRVLVPELADWSAADLMDEDGAVERVWVSHRDPNAALTGLTGPLPPVPETVTGPLSRVLCGAGPLLLSEGGCRPRRRRPIRCSTSRQAFGCGGLGRGTRRWAAFSSASMGPARLRLLRFSQRAGGAADVTAVTAPRDGAHGPAVGVAGGDGEFHARSVPS
ncbi:hypothetical protein ABT215_00150 [Streptomyces sp900105755]|uniref:hypothetical protein n=1 Tax=unclassified Streptomyces TaxID=2593676 RepID=UPI00331F2CA4